MPARAAVALTLAAAPMVVSGLVRVGVVASVLVHIAASLVALEA